MTSPIEPGIPGSGPSPMGAESTERAGSHRGPVNPPSRPVPPRPSADYAGVTAGSRSESSAGSEAASSDVYGSELPDLSGVTPRLPQPRTAAPSDAAAKVGSMRRATPGTRGLVAKRDSGPVRASMQVRRIDPWSTLKVSLVLSVAVFFVWMISVALLYLVLGGMGVWGKLNSNVGDLLNNTGGSGGELISAGAIFGGAVLIGLVNIVLMTAMATIGAFVYNLTTDLIGGIEVTLADRD